MRFFNLSAICILQFRMVTVANIHVYEPEASARRRPSSLTLRVSMVPNCSKSFLLLLLPDVPMRVDVDPIAGRKVGVAGPFGPFEVAVVAEVRIILLVPRDSNTAKQLVVLAVHVSLGRNGSG